MKITKYALVWVALCAFVSCILQWNPHYIYSNVKLEKGAMYVLTIDTNAGVINFIKK